MTHFSLFKKPLQITLSFWLREILLFYNNYRVSSTVTISSYSLESQNICHDGVVKRICIPRSRVASAVLRHQTTEAPHQDASADPQARDCCTLLSTISCHQVSFCTQSEHLYLLEGIFYPFTFTAIIDTFACTFLILSLRFYTVCSWFHNDLEINILFEFHERVPPTIWSFPTSLPHRNVPLCLLFKTSSIL